MSYPYYPFYPGDYARDTIHLSLVQHGVYRLLIDWYMTSGPIQTDIVGMCRALRAFPPEERQAVEFIIESFFVYRDGAWHHNRCDRELAKLALLSERQRVRAGKRWAVDNSMPRHSHGSAAAMPNQNQNQITSTPPESLPPPQTGTAGLRAGSWLAEGSPSARHSLTATPEIPRRMACMGATGTEGLDSRVRQQGVRDVS